MNFFFSGFVAGLIQNLFDLLISVYLFAYLWNYVECESMLLVYFGYCTDCVAVRKLSSHFYWYWALYQHVYLAFWVFFASFSFLSFLLHLKGYHPFIETAPTSCYAFFQADILTFMSVMFSFVYTAKIPFPLTQRFRSMLQNGIDLSTVDVSYVSSRSWYLLICTFFIFFLSTICFQNILPFEFLRCEVTENNFCQVFPQLIWTKRFI